MNIHKGRNLRICHVITRLIIGGAQENTIFTVEGLIEKGYNVELISGKTEGPEGSLVDYVKKKKIPLIIIPELVREINPVKDIIAFLKLLSIFKNKKYHIVHTHSAKAGILGRIASKIANSKSIVIHTVHGLPFHPYQPFFLNFLYIMIEKFTARFTDCFITVGEVMKEKSLKEGIGEEKKYRVIYSGFDVEKYKNAEKKRKEIREKFGIKDGEKVIGMVGRLFHLKGQEYLLEAFSKIVKEFPDARLLLVGDGILKNKLKEYAKEKGIYNKVIFAGLVPPSEIPLYISAMDIVAHTSLREGLPKAVAQGFAGGKPVVSFDIDGAREIVIDGKTGFLVPPRDVSSLFKKLLFLLQNEDIAIKMGKEGRKIIEEKFPVKKMVDEIERLYLELSEKRFAEMV